MICLIAVLTIVISFRLSPGDTGDHHRGLNTVCRPHRADRGGPANRGEVGLHAGQGGPLAGAERAAGVPRRRVRLRRGDNLRAGDHRAVLGSDPRRYATGRHRGAAGRAAAAAAGDHGRARVQVLALPALWAHAAVPLAALPTGTGPFMLAELHGREAAVTSQVILLLTICSVVMTSLLLALFG